LDIELDGEEELRYQEEPDTTADGFSPATGTADTTGVHGRYDESTTVTAQNPVYRYFIVFAAVRWTFALPNGDIKNKCGTLNGVAGSSLIAMANGKVDFFNDTGGYGFISTEDADEDVFFHMEDVGGPDLEEGQDIDFDIEQAPKGPRATNVVRN
jgi:CspA family cold shock protein